MRRHGITPEITGLKNDAFPEIVHARQVLLPVYFGHIVKKIPNGIICPHFGVEGVDELLNVATVGDICFHVLKDR